MEKALFAAGCFWGVEASFAELSGVIDTEVGYSGGIMDNPTYEDVCDGDTRHAETVQVIFDPARIPYAMLVEKFFAMHDPTQIDRQGPDIGDQYRSAIFYLTSEQQRIAQEIKDRLQKSGRYKKPVATRIEPAGTFWPAEDYHQQYFAKRGSGSCHF